jgi:ectoine hydroxylase-related dioxygenase (phytanoyl-CoA dioxygenase family)
MASNPRTQPQWSCPYLTAAQYDEYWTNGYVVVEKLFTPAECDEIHELSLVHAEPGHPAILNLDRKVPRLRDYMKDPRAVSILDTLQGTEVVGTMSQILFKRAGSQYATQAWNPHQDNAYPQNPNGRYLTINIALTEQDLGNGCLYIFKGSHKEGLYPCETTPSYREIPGTNPGNTVASHILERFERADLMMAKGDALFLHGNVVHGSYPNNSPTRSRPMMQYTYIDKGEPFIAGRNANRMAIPVR